MPPFPDWRTLLQSGLSGGEPVALLEVESDIYAIKYGPINLALLKGKRGVCQPGWRIDPATGNKTGNLQPMSPG